MASIKVSSVVDAKVWRSLKALSEETQRSLSGLLTEAIAEYVQRRRVRPEVLDHLERSMDENEKLGKLLAR